MKRNSFLIFGLLSFISLAGCKEKSDVSHGATTNAKGQHVYQEMKNSFLLISPEIVAEFTPGQPIKELYKGSGITCAATIGNIEKIVVGTTSGYFFFRTKKL